ncbi:transcription elongation factor GreA [soil metagenome]
MEKEKIEITSDGHERLQAELKNLLDIERPKIIEAVADARSHGDLRENSAYDAARQDQAMIEKRISDLEATLRNAVVITPDKVQGSPDSIGLGSKVVVDFGGEEENFTIVGAAEARPAQGFISNASPIGKALDGRRKGESVKAHTPGGLIDLTIKSVDNSSR